MGIFDSIKKAADAFLEDLNTPESFKKGQKFETFTREVIFSADRYTLLKKTHDYGQNSKDYVQESLEPDYKFECKETKRQFYVESKFRSWFYQGKIELCSPNQFKRLQEINKQEPVFILLGLDGEPDDPEYVCLIPLCDIKSTSITETFLENYDIAHNVSISPKKLWSNYDQKPHSTGHHGYCIRCKRKLQLDVKHPLCTDCYSDWSKYKNNEFPEKYCHACGNANKGSYSRPLCYSCFRNSN